LPIAFTPFNGRIIDGSPGLISSVIVALPGQMVFEHR